MNLDDLKPISIINSGLENLMSPLGLNKTVLTTSTEIAAIFIAKKIFIKRSYLRFANVFVPLILMAGIKTITNHPEKSKLAVNSMLKMVGRAIGATPDITYFS